MQNSYRECSYCEDAQEIQWSSDAEKTLQRITSRLSRLSMSTESHALKEELSDVLEKVNNHVRAEE